ncbi:ABC transporter substrate-binding protein [Psychrobacter sp. YP14]|jgi:putative ABC transport system substrate-binding protein|uniref:ABC transporter substrate-binding protein n=3 Tax=Psychrobacter TaxID=497 RepID=A0A844M0E0_9GAMM|nr:MULTISPECIES: ABC transporter substrate-binding protein [Psychrobacter]AWT49447.1 ABC transporter substrate-binding protein [Psychrobacter sp. YP14]MUG32243.1 ABC transporter substrate-binding protein [Psychrobacter sanguinis]
MFNPNRFVKTLMWGGVATAILAGCNQQPSTDTAAQSSDDTKAGTSSEVKHVAITAIVEHPALDAVRQGVVEELAEEGFVEGKNLEINFQSAQGNTATAGQIAKQFVGDNPDVIVAIATPSAQSVAAATNTIPLVFSAVTDPVEAKLLKSMDGSGTNVTGASDALPYAPQIDLMKQIIPSLKNVGYVYSPGEVNSTVILKNLQEQLQPMGITVHSAPAQKSNDIAMAARSIADKVDVIYTSTDNNVVSAYESLYQVAKESKVPLIASDTSSVERGAIAALGVNYHDLGRETGKIVGRILKGEKPGDIPVYTPTSLDLYVSPTHAKEQGIELSKEVMDQAKEVVK